MLDSAHPLHRLRRQIAAIERPLPKKGIAVAATGHPGIDRALGGGLPRGRLHEVFAAEPDDAGSAAGFASMLAQMLGGGIIWLREERVERQAGGLHAPGLREIGIDPARLILGLLPDPLAVLRAAADVVRCPEAGVAVVELWRNPRQLDLTASRRLALAAETSGVTVLLLRVSALPAPSTAHTRWAVRSAPSLPLEANAPGHPAMEVELLRQRGRPAGGVWQVEWDREQTIFRDRNRDRPALSGAVVPLPVRGPAGADEVIPFRRTG